MKIIGLMRVKNEARWIRESVESLKPLCDPIIVLDDHSDDGTPDICEASGAIVLRSLFKDLDEARDKDFLLFHAAKHSPDWAFMLDGDELLTPESPAAIRKAIESGLSLSYTVRFLYLWDSMDKVRVDGIYANTWRQSCWKFAPRQQFRRTQFGGNFHCGSVPKQFLLSAKKCEGRILHLGYLHREDRVRKYEFYNRLDPLNTHEDCYRHMVIGDLFPAETRTKWAGPLGLQALP